MTDWRWWALPRQARVLGPLREASASNRRAEKERLLDSPARLEWQGHEKAGTITETLLRGRPTGSHRGHKHLSRVQWAGWSVPPLRRPPPRAHLLDLRF